MTLPFLDLSGEPEARGRAHGAALAASIRANVETYLRRFEASGLDRDAALAGGAEWDRAITAANPEYAAEMHGIAAGAELPRPVLALLNARYETAFTLFGKDARAADRAAGRPATEPSGCTTAGLMPEITADGGCYLLQNWDWLADVHGHCVVIRQRGTDHPDMLYFTEAGIVGGKMGMNAEGIGLVENGLACDRDGANPFEKPFHMRCREVLQGRTLHDAMLPVVATRRVCSANFMVGDAGGEIVDLETSPDHVTTLHPQGGVLAHSNHFLTAGHGVSQMERIAPNTLFRAARLERLLRAEAKAAGGRIDRDGMERALSDRLSSPNALCRTPDTRLPRARQTMTVAAFVLDLGRREMWVCDGPPSPGAFRRYGLAEDGTAQAAAE